MFTLETSSIDDRWGCQSKCFRCKYETMKKSRTKPEPRPYHHGDLRAALLAAAEEILEKEGIQALTLRAAARAVGVSHTAPQNHFGDLTGLLSELAAIGYRRFT